MRAAKLIEQPIQLQFASNPLFQTLLTNLKQATRLDATRVLVEIGKQNLDIIIPVLKQALTTPCPELQWTALYELFEASRLQPEKLFTIIDLTIRQSHFETTFANTRILVELGKTAPQQVLPLFEQAIESQNEQATWAAVLELAQLSQLHPDDFMPLIEKATASDNPHIQWLALLALMELAKVHPHKTAPIFKRLLQTESDLPTFHTTCNLVNINSSNPQQAFVLLRLALNSNNSELEWQAMLELLALVESYPDKVIPILEEALDSTNPHIQWLASLELNQLATDFPDEIMPILQKAASQQPAESFNTARVLVELGKESLPETLPLFEQALESNNPCLQAAAFSELSELGKTNPQPALHYLDHFFHQKTITDKIKPTRILINLEKCEPQEILIILKIALRNSDNQALQRAAFKELIQLIKKGVIDIDSIAPLLN